MILITRKNIILKFVIHPSAFSYSVATMAMAMILAYQRKLITNHNLVRKNKWPKLLGETLLNKKVGIIGLGNIGKKFFK